MQVNVHEAKTQLSRLLELGEEGETVVMARHGQPVAELVLARQTRLSFRHRPLANRWSLLRQLVADDHGRGSPGLDRRPVKVLTDTHSLVWTKSDLVSRAAREALACSAFTASVANRRELVLKTHKPEGDHPFYRVFPKSVLAGVLAASHRESFSAMCSRIRVTERAGV